MGSTFPWVTEPCLSEVVAAGPRASGQLKKKVMGMALHWRSASLAHAPAPVTQPGAVSQLGRLPKKKVPGDLRPTKTNSEKTETGGLELWWIIHNLTIGTGDLRPTRLGGSQVPRGLSRTFCDPLLYCLEDGGHAHGLVVRRRT